MEEIKKRYLLYIVELTRPDTCNSTHIAACCSLRKEEVQIRYFRSAAGIRINQEQIHQQTYLLADTCCSTRRIGSVSSTYLHLHLHISYKLTKRIKESIHRNRRATHQFLVHVSRLPLPRSIRSSKKSGSDPRRRGCCCSSNSSSI